jgi:hypothetical protein
MNRKGIILPLVLLIIMVVVVLANVAVSIMNNQNRFTHHQVSRIRAYYASQAAMNLAFERMRGGNFASFSLCPSAGACGAPSGGNAIIDAGDGTNPNPIPYRVDVNIGGAGTAPATLGGAGGLGGTVRPVTISVNYTPI